MLNSIRLHKGQLITLQPQPLHLLAGEIWITIPGHQRDYILQEGQSFLAMDQEILVECLSLEALISLHTFATREKAQSCHQSEIA